ncbi:tetratricopeptide repeat protein [Streptomyces sp. NPDC019224]|uniref:tetratricopeptide repeat protein n=1 Tax=Streptomyces sp. NPDC019224 TaxID=3154484 RepID=UPI0033DC2855
MRLFRSRVRRTKPSPATRAVELYKAERYAEAEKAARAVARSRPRDRGELLVALTVAAVSTGAQGRHAEALTAYDEALSVSRKLFGTGHWQTLKLRSDRAQQLASLDRHAECEAESEAVVREAAGGTHPEIRRVAAAATNGVVFALNAQGHHAKAETLARDALAELREPHRIRLVLQIGLARSLNGQARYEEALAEAATAGELHRALPEGQRGPEAGAVDLVAATALLGLGRVTEARTRADAAHDACLASFGPAHRRTVEARELLDRFDAA